MSGQASTPKLTVVVVTYNMAREAPRTVRSLSPAMQRDISPDDYEIILIDNGSTQPVDEEGLRRLAPNLIIRRMPNATVSPVPAINLGMALARGDLIGIFIDGARMASPGLLAYALAASRLHPRPMIGTIAFHLGPSVQMESVKHGYDQRAEDALLAQSSWEDDGYRLFGISAFAGSSAGGWFDLPAESNAVFLRAEHWRDLGGWDERFETPGGGLANLDMWSRICADPDGQLIMLLGEATFHQVHGGVATNSPDPPQAAFHAEYAAIRGEGYVRPTRKPLFFGHLPAAVGSFGQHPTQLVPAPAAHPAGTDGFSDTESANAHLARAEVRRGLWRDRRSDTRTMTSNTGLYIDLLIRTLTNTIYQDPSIHFERPGPYQAAVRDVGRDWPRTAHTMVGVQRLTHLAELAAQTLADGVPGDFIETGVWRGGCCILLRGVLAAHGVTDRRVYLADSFAGLPPPNSAAFPKDDGFDLSGFTQLAVSLEEVRDNFSRYGLLDDQVVFVKGWFSETLMALKAGPFALIRLDGDLYESTYVALQALYPKLSPGGFVIIDDFNAIQQCKDAVMDYRARFGIETPLRNGDWSEVWWRKE